MGFLNRYKGTIVGLLLLVGLFFVYTQFIAGTPNDPLLTSKKVSGVDGTQAGQEIIRILKDIQQINLNVSLFDNVAFVSLVDFRTVVSPEPAGRDNPFDPIGFGTNRSGRVVRPLPPNIQLIEPTQSSEQQSGQESTEEVGS